MTTGRINQVTTHLKSHTSHNCAMKNTVVCCETSAIG